MLKIAQWFNNYQAPVVLMIDDLSDAYISVYDETYKNDWGYFCNTEGSVFNFLHEKLLRQYPEIKITFFVPYLKHAVINENTPFTYKKYALGERKEYINFLKYLVLEGHEIAHHGSDHGRYINNKKVSTVQNWIHEWALFDNIETGVNITLDGVNRFKEYANIDVLGGKYCGYISINNSQEIIDQCDFLYWCEKANYTVEDYGSSYFGRNNIISFPTNFAGNSFVRLSYMTGHPKRDKKKKFLKFLQPLYNFISYYKLLKLYQQRHIISIQEHISPSTASGTIQSANIVTDISSLKKTYGFLYKHSIWHATCHDIAKYISVRDNSLIDIQDNEVIVVFTNKKRLQHTKISIIGEEPFSLMSITQQIFQSTENNGTHVVNIPIVDGRNIYKYIKVGHE